jgi:hypothetical protein
VKPYLKRGKSDAHDARAIWEAASRPDMRFVRVKSEEQQAALMQHTSRQLLIDQRTAVANSLRGQLAEFGVIEKKGIENVGDLVRMLDDDARVPASALMVMKILADQLRAVDAHLSAIDEQIEAWQRESAAAQALEDIEQAIAGIQAEDDKKDPVAAGAYGEKRRANRGALPAHLPRLDVTIEPEDTNCPSCRASMHVIGEERSGLSAQSRAELGGRVCLNDRSGKADLGPEPISR